jgi:hypothetical protein
MIIPTADFDPLFANDGIPFREKMIEYIIREFGDTLAARADLRLSELLWETRFENKLPSANATSHQHRAA